MAFFLCRAALLLTLFAPIALAREYRAIHCLQPFPLFLDFSHREDPPEKENSQTLKLSHAFPGSRSLLHTECLRSLQHLQLEGMRIPLLPLPGYPCPLPLCSFWVPVHPGPAQAMP